MSYESRQLRKAQDSRIKERYRLAESKAESLGARKYFGQMVFPVYKGQMWNVHLSDFVCFVSNGEIIEEVRLGV